MTSPKVLYLEDEFSLGRIVKESLASRGFEIHLIEDGAKVMDQLGLIDPDICVLDVMVPNIDGFTLGELIKEQRPDLPIIFLTAKNQTEDVIQGFHSGGNDYIKKPFSMEELIVRINNLLAIKEPNGNLNPLESIALGQYEFSSKKFQLTHKDEIINLSHRENELLFLLSKNVNQKIDRRLILKQLWGDDDLYNSRNLDVYIRKLRTYLENDPKIRLITLRGIGYHFSIDQ